MHEACHYDEVQDERHCPFRRSREDARSKAGPMAIDHAVRNNQGRIEFGKGQGLTQRSGEFASA